MTDWVTVHTAAEVLGVSSDTIRRWEKKGLIQGQRNDLNFRVFSVTQLQELKHKLNNTAHNKGFYVLKNPETTTYRSLELFAGAGGMALGFENAGLHHEALVEWDAHAVSTLRHNRPSWNVLHGDVSGVDFSTSTADVVVGGFPCQAFSYAGQRMGFDDTRGTLFFEFARCVREVQPKVLVGENVRGLEKHDNGRTLSTMLGVLDELGYTVAYKILRAQYFDVAQKRERLVILGVRKDLNLPLLFPKEHNYTVSLREALADVPPSEGQHYSARKQQVLSLVPEGGYWRDLPEDIQKEFMGASYYLGGGKTGMARRLAWNEPSLTLTCSPAQKQTERCHPSETRPLTVREYARIQSFPDDWQFQGSITAQYKQIGNAVPVNLAYHVARAVIAMLDNKPTPEFG